MKQWLDLSTLLLTASLALWVNQTAWAQENTDNIESSLSSHLNTTQEKMATVLEADIWKGMSKEDKKNIRNVFLETMGHEVNEKEMGKFIKKLLEQQDIQNKARSIRDNNKQYTNADVIMTLLVWLGGGYFIATKRRPEDLKESDKSALEVFAEIAPWPIVKYWEDGYPLIWNPKMVEETGYSHQEVIDYYENKKKKLPPEASPYIIMGLLYKRDNLVKVHQYLEKKEKTWEWYIDVPFTLTTKSEEENTLLWSAVPDPNGGDLRMARHLTANDFELFAEIAPWPVVKYREDGYPLIWNPKMVEETGYSHQEVIDYYNDKRQNKNLSPEEYPYIIMTLLYKGNNFMKVHDYLVKLKQGKWKGYANVTFIMDTKFGEEKTFCWSAAPGNKGGDLRMAQRLTAEEDIHNALQEMEERIKEMEEEIRIEQEKAKEAEEKARRCPKTGAYNDIALMEDIRTLFLHNYWENMALLFIDVDMFKEVNSTYGHEGGDDVLKQLVIFLQENIRKENTDRHGDKLYRPWGDEFIILMEIDDVHNMIEKITKIRQGFHSIKFFWKAHIGTSWWGLPFNTRDYIKYDKDGKLVVLTQMEIDGIIKQLKEDADRYMYAVKEYNYIENELVNQGKIQANQPPKNGLALPEYDDKWELLWVQVFNNFGSFFITTEQLDTIKRLKAEDDERKRKEKQENDDERKRNQKLENK